MVEAGGPGMTQRPNNPPRVLFPIKVDDRRCVLWASFGRDGNDPRRRVLVMFLGEIPMNTGTGLRQPEMRWGFAGSDDQVRSALVKDLQFSTAAAYQLVQSAHQMEKTLILKSREAV